MPCSSPASLLGLVLATCLLAMPQGAHAQAEADSSDAPVLTSSVRIFDLDTRTARTVLSAEAHYEAPNWTNDGRHLIFNAEGILYRVPVDGGAPERIDTGEVTDIINDHGISPDGTTLAFTAGPDYHIYTVPIEGGTPVQVTEQAPSYWHGWSPDGKTLAYVGRRDGIFDMYTIPVTGGEEKQLTFDAAHDDGPDYSPDGRYIYWNTDRSGHFDIWRMPADGGETERVTSDAWEDWFPHPSPDGEHIVFLSYPPGTEGHPANQNVKLRMIGPEGGEPEDLLDLFGGQGTINVPSWAPDSRAFAFVAYEVE